jgi:hypothetical protein
MVIPSRGCFESNSKIEKSEAYTRFTKRGGRVLTYVPGVKYDVFISYAHDDDVVLEYRWVSNFKSHLKSALTRRLGESPEIFLDTLDVDPHHTLVTDLLDNVRQSAVFLPVFSPLYVARPWTIEELNAFSEAAGESGRIVVVEVLPLNANDLFPPQLRDLKRTIFWWKDETRTHTAFTLMPLTKPIEYATNVDDLAERLAGRLRGMKYPHNDAFPQRGSQVREEARPRVDTAVLLAQVTEDLDADCKQLRRYLEKYFRTVLPESEYPQGGTDFAKAFEADLEKADVFVQLLGGFASRHPPDLPEGYAQHQSAAASRAKEERKKTGRNLTVLQWRHLNLDLSKVTHRDKQLLDGPEVIATGLEEFKREIVRRNQEPQARPGKGEFVFIDFDPSDRDIADTFLNVFEAKKRETYIPLSKGSAGEVDKELDENLIGCKALFLIYGKVSACWVRAQTRRCNKVLQYRTDSLPIKKIVLGPPPPKDERADIGVSIFETIDCQNDASTERVQRIVNELGL